MTGRRAVVLAALWGGPGGVPPDSGAPPPSPLRGRYAVLDFRTADFGQQFGQGWWGGARPQLENAVSDMLASEMARAGFDVVERARLKDVLAEQALAQTGSLDPESAVRMGRILGARYLLVGTVSEWGIRERGIGGLRVPDPLFGGRRTEVGVGFAVARVVLDFRVVDAETGRIVAADRAEGSETRPSVSLSTSWYRTLNLRDTEWWSSQIGRATRKAASTIPARILGTGPEEVVVLEMLSDTEFVIEIDPKRRPRKGDTYVVQRTVQVVRNAQGRVVYRKTEPIATAKVVEVQENGAVLRIVKVEPGETVRPGALVARR